MTVNAEKSKAIVIQRKTKKTPGEEIQINNESIKWEKQAKYLGVKIDHRLTFTKHVDTVRYARSKLRPLIGRKSKLNIKDNITLIKIIIMPILTYASLAWGHTCKTNRRKIQARENLSVTPAINAPCYVRNEIFFRGLKITPVTEKIKTRARIQFEKLNTTHPNMRLRQLTDNDPRFRERYKRSRIQELSDDEET